MKCVPLVGVHLRGGLQLMEDGRPFDSAQDRLEGGVHLRIGSGVMIKKTFVLSFPEAVVQQPVTYHLVKDYNWIVNILRARVNPDLRSNEEGMLVIEAQGQSQNIEQGLDYLSRIGVQHEPLAQDVTWNEECCTHCTACTSLCPTGALSVQRPEMIVSFDREKCIACEACLKVCSYNAVTISI